MNDKIFVDTNILVYSVANDKRKKEIASEIMLRRNISISSQVVSEFVAVTIGKQILPLEKAVKYAKQFMQVFPMKPQTHKTIASAFDIMMNYQFSYWDSLIIAAAMENGCAWLYSEDMQDGQRIDHALTIYNPFNQPQLR